MTYWLIKQVHVSAVMVSIALFVLRGIWMLAAPALLERRWVKVVPHVVDSVLLASAIGLTLIIGQYPFVAPWLSAKVLALVVYILLGTVALKRGPTLTIRLLAFVGALASVTYIVLVARAHAAWPL